MAERQPSADLDDEMSYYLRWVAGGLVVGFLAGVVLSVNPFGTAIAAVGVLLIGNGVLLVPEWWQARSMERRQIGSVQPDGGAVEVVGEAAPAGETVTAPITGEECLAYTLSIEDYEYHPRRRGRGSYRWSTKFWDTERPPFVVDDGTGQAYVDPRDAEVHFPREYYVEVEAGERPPDEVLRGLGGGGERFAVGDGSIRVVNESEKRRYKEFHLDVGEEVLVSGQSNQPTGNLAGRVRTVLSDGPDAPWYTISSDPETEVNEELAGRVRGALLGGSVIAVGGALVALFV